MNAELLQRVAISLGITLFMSLIGYVMWHIRKLREHMKLTRRDRKNSLFIRSVTLDHTEHGIRFVVRNYPYMLLADAVRTIPGREHIEAFLESADHRSSVIPLPGQNGTAILADLAAAVKAATPRGVFAEDHWTMVVDYCASPEGVRDFDYPAITLIRPEDLQLFLDWNEVQKLLIAQSADALTILTLHEAALKLEQQLARLEELREAGLPTTYVEEFWTIRLYIDASIPPEPPLFNQRRILKPYRRVPWVKFAAQLEARKLPYPPAPTEAAPTEANSATA